MASTLSAEMFDDSDVTYSYDIEMNDDESVFKYLVDSTYYDQFSAKVLGVYIIYNDVPMKITKDLNKMARILKHYIFLNENPNYGLSANDNEFSLTKAKSTFDKIIQTERLFSLTSNRFLNQAADARDFSRILEKHYDFTAKGIAEMQSSLTIIYKRKIALYTRQNNKQGLEFCKEVNKGYIVPLSKLVKQLDDYNKPQTPIRKNFKKFAIERLNIEELKIFWDDFKENDLGLIQTYFNANEKKLKQLDENNSFEIELDDVDWNGMPKFYISLNIFGQQWYLSTDYYNVSGLHKVNLIKL
ncbi:MAG: hypothetical protein ACJZ8T_03305 [Coraliomargaritaceae bacterium]